jgi:hypothetical protein
MCRSVCSTVDQPCPPSCDLCTSGRPAVNYCLDCSENLCHKCSDHHKEGKKTHSHQLDALDGNVASSGHDEAGGYGENVERGGRENDVLMSPTKKRRMAHVTTGNKIICCTCKVVLEDEEELPQHPQHEIACFQSLRVNDYQQKMANDLEMRRAQDALFANDQQKKAVKIEGLRRIDACRQAVLKRLMQFEEEIRSSTYLPWKTDQEHGDDLKNYVARREENDAQWRLVSDMSSKLALSNDPGPGISDYLEARVRAAGDASAIKRFEEKPVSSLILVPDLHAEIMSMLERCMDSCLHLVWRDVHPAHCVAKGPGLEKIFTGGSAHFTLVAHASNGSPCASGGDVITVQVFSGDTDVPTVGRLSQEACRGAGAAASGAAAAAQHQLACDFDCRDHGNGRYSCKYSIPEDVIIQAGRSVKVVVCVNGMALLGSAGVLHFTVHVLEGCSVEFEESRPFEGVIHHLATQGGRSEFENPHTSKTVKVSAATGIERGSLACFVSGPEHHDRGNFTKDLSSDGKTSSVQVDLKDWEVVPRYYSIRNDLTLTHMLKSWSLEVSGERECARGRKGLGGEGSSESAWWGGIKISMFLT